MDLYSAELYGEITRRQDPFQNFQSEVATLIRAESTCFMLMIAVENEHLKTKSVEDSAKLLGALKLCGFLLVAEFGRHLRSM